MRVLKSASDGDALAVLRWRNAESVRRTMITQDAISLEQHLAWWSRVKADRTKRVLLLQEGDATLGVVNFFDIANSPDARTGWWGFYPTDMAKAPGIGALRAWLAIEKAALTYAFEILQLDSLLCETRAENLGVLSLHDRLGFETLAPAPYPNAVAHNLIVKKMSRAAYERARTAGDLQDDQELRIEMHEFDAVAPATPVLRLAILGSANWDIGGRRLTAAFEHWMGWRVETYVPPFGQASMELLDAHSRLRRESNDVWIFAERFEDFGNPFALPGQTDESIVLDRFKHYEAQILNARNNVEGLFLIHDLAPTRGWFRSLEEAASGADAVSQLCAAMNQRLSALAKEMPDTILLPISALVRDIGARQADPGKFWLMGRVAYGAAMNDVWADAVVGAVLSRRGATARALIFDLDNTLWGGAIGDEGVSGVSLSSDHPGNEFKAVQEVAVALKTRGLPLTISSKNNDATAMEAIRAHPEMVLRESDFVARRINWSPKSQNIREIADELSLGLGSLMFIDDNPIERAETRRNCPGLIVPEMPEDVALWPEFLLNHPALAAISLSAEDLQRARSYDIRRQIVAAEQAAPSREAFLAELGMTLEMRDATPQTMQRVLQLIAKTNQFNTTSRRYSAADLVAKIAAGGRILTMRLKDKFGSDELIGVLVVDFWVDRRRASIDNFIMSCRVLGRGLEAGAIAVVAEAAQARGCVAIEAGIILSDRNEPCRTVFIDNGFADLGELRYELMLEESPPLRPAWLTIDADA